MSIEVWQFPENATDAELSELLILLGFTKGENLFWTGPNGTKHFFWSDNEDFKSTSGVDASIFPLDEQGKKAWDVPSCDWALRTRTSMWASSFDQEFHNSTVRAVRKNYGGRFYNDHYGHNRYIVIGREKSTPQSRGIYSVCQRLDGELYKLENSLPEEMVKSLVTPKGVFDETNDETGIFEFTKQQDPSRVIYNAMVPFLIAILEHFFRESFETLLKYDLAAKEKLGQSSRKVPFDHVSAVVRGDTKLETIVSSWYSFQNLDSINKAYCEILNIDIWKVLRRRKKVREKLPILADALNNLVSARHGVIHHFTLDRSLSREDFLDLLHLCKTIIDIVCEEFERKLGVTIGPG